MSYDQKHMGGVFSTIGAGIKAAGGALSKGAGAIAKGAGALAKPANLQALIGSAVAVAPLFMKTGEAPYVNPQGAGTYTPPAAQMPSQYAAPRNASTIDKYILPAAILGGAALILLATRKGRSR
jgi:hypothetical protein